jgi:hypothetical protein
MLGQQRITLCGRYAARFLSVVERRIFWKIAAIIACCTEKRTPETTDDFIQDLRQRIRRPRLPS